MKAFAVVSVWRFPPPQWHHVSTKSEFKGDEEGYSIGYVTKLDNGIKPYVEVGAGLSAADGER